jgi:hypothetical protein
MQRNRRKKCTCTKGATNSIMGVSPLVAVLFDFECHWGAKKGFCSRRAAYCFAKVSCLVKNVNST